MRLLKTIVFTTSIMVLTACGGGGDTSSSPEAKSTYIPPPPKFSVVAGQTTVGVIDGKSAVINLTIENTTSEVIEFLIPDESASEAMGDSPITFSYLNGQLTVAVSETDSIYAEKSHPETIRFKAGTLTSEVTINIVVQNNELSEFLSNQEKLFAVRHLVGPFKEIEKVTWRYMLQANILGYISDSEFESFKNNSASQRQQFIQSGLEQTNNVYDKYATYTPASDAESEVANLAIKGAISKYTHILEDYYHESRLKHLVSLDTGLPMIYTPFISLDERTGAATIFQNGFYGTWEESQNGREFQLLQEYDFLDSLEIIKQCVASV